jgi:membrane-associated protease RseP (regulator of RpoE activity)
MKFFLSLAILAIAWPALADDKKDQKAVPIPYRLTDTKHVMVRVKMNGKGPYNLILDTGAPAMFITTKVAKEVGVANKKGWANFDKLVLEGGLKVDDARCRVEDLFQLEGMNSLGMAGVELHGVIGYEILARYRITYDFTKEKIDFVPLDFKPQKLQGVGGGGQGSLEMIGPIMKIFGGFMGIVPNFNIQPRGYMGLVLKDNEKGVVVEKVLEGGPAELAELKAGDVIATMKGSEVSTSKDLIKLSSKLKPGDTLKLIVKRDGQEKTMTLHLGSGF